MSTPLSFRITLLLFASISVPLWSYGQEAEDEGENRLEYQLILPEEKTPESVKPNEVNPFSKLSGLMEDDSSSEENQVKEVLQSLPVTGISTNPEGGKRVMLGGFKLERGTVVPQVLPGQSVKLRVNSVSDTTLEMVWVEKKNTGLPPRMLIIPFSVKPSIRFQLVGSPGSAGGPGGAGGKEASYGVIQGGSPEASPPPPPPPAAVVENQVSPPSGSPALPPAATPPAAGDANHPANMLMNLLLSKPQPTQQPAP